uniref:Link domain-containing protein n=1 Tax=Nothobranchius furzeri TaxID=105023 RepID=A0A8C6L9Y9_NOTFU
GFASRQCCVLLQFFLIRTHATSEVSQILIFPAENQSIAGVVQVSYADSRNQLQYAFNASEARKFCRSLRLSIASKAQVEAALRRGLETCRFGWIDEHFVVIPRKMALPNCGRNRTGLVPWRVTVTAKFDVFCFNESGTPPLVASMKTIAFNINLNQNITCNFRLVGCSVGTWKKIELPYLVLHLLPASFLHVLDQHS